MNRYWGGLLAATFVALMGLYLFYKAIRGEEVVIYRVFTLSPRMLVITGLLAETIFFLYVWLGINTGVFDLL
jgi:hypothetical protein